MVLFNKAPLTGNEKKYVLEAVKSKKLSGGGVFTTKCEDWFKKQLNCNNVLLTPSCTQALEMAALLIDIKPGDEVIMPSYTFVSTANAFVLRGANIVFVDIRPDTLNINEQLIQDAITDKTKAIVVVHYAGIACEMDIIMAIADRYDIFVIEDAAQAIMSSYKGRKLGTIGQIGALSFHETKNVTSGGEGGLIIVNDDRFVSRSEIIREKGTNRSLFVNGLIDKYSWVDIGSSYLLGEINAAYLLGQLESISEIYDYRKYLWNQYYDSFQDLNDKGICQIPFIPNHCENNYHIFYLVLKNNLERDMLIRHLSKRGIQATSHYVPLHSSIAGQKFGRFSGEDNVTTDLSGRLIRLPIFYGMLDKEIKNVIQDVIFYLKP
jgi:dTDP-4-amino-4,6-dideoxygalactose transaminase